MRTPTKRQYARLIGLGSGAAALSWTKGEVAPFLKHGWVTADAPQNGQRYYQFIRITPDGLRALADAVAVYGLPEMVRSEARTTVRVCADCGSGSYGFKDIPAEEYVALKERRRAAA